MILLLYTLWHNICSLLHLNPQAIPGFFIKAPWMLTLPLQHLSLKSCMPTLGVTANWELAESLLMCAFPKYTPPFPSVFMHQCFVSPLNCAPCLHHFMTLNRELVWYGPAWYIMHSGGVLVILRQSVGNSDRDNQALHPMSPKRAQRCSERRNVQGWTHQKWDRNNRSDWPLLILVCPSFYLADIYIAIHSWGVC